MSNEILLYESLRPKCLEDLVDKLEIIDEERLFIAALKRGSLSSSLMWDYPGSGKTSFAKTLAKEKEFDFSELSSVSNGVSRLDKERGFGDDYYNAHDCQEGQFINQNYFPEGLEKNVYISTFRKTAI